MSNVNVDRIGLLASGDTLIFPLREQLAVVRDEITELQDSDAGHFGIAAFYFGSLSGAMQTDGAWHTVTTSGGGMTGDQSVASASNSGLTLAVDCLVQVKVWVECQAAGSGAERVAIQLDESAYITTNGVRVRGQIQLLPNQTTMFAAYDGWLSAGAILNVVSASTIDNTIQPTSYVTVILTPVS